MQKLVVRWVIWAFSAMLLGCKGETYKNGSCHLFQANLVGKDAEECHGIPRQTARSWWRWRLCRPDNGFCLLAIVPRWGEVRFGFIPQADLEMICRIWSYQPALPTRCFHDTARSLRDTSCMWGRCLSPWRSVRRSFARLPGAELSWLDLTHFSDTSSKIQTI